MELNLQNGFEKNNTNEKLRVNASTGKPGRGNRNDCAPCNQGAKNRVIPPGEQLGDFTQTPRLDEKDNHLVGSDHDTRIGHLADVVRAHAPIQTGQSLFTSHLAHRAYQTAIVAMGFAKACANNLYTNEKIERARTI